MSSLALILATALVLFFAPTGMHATRTEGGTQDAWRTAHPQPLTGRDLLAPHEPASADCTRLEDLDEVQPRADSDPAPKTPAAASGPSIGALWIYALSGCAAVGLVAFRGDGPRK